MLNIFNSRIWSSKPSYNKGGEKILIVNSVPAFQNSALLESFLGDVFASRDFEVAYAFCDGVLPACLNTKYGSVKSVHNVLDGTWKKSNKACKRCSNNIEKHFSKEAAKFYFSQYCENTDQKDILNRIDAYESPFDWEYRGIKIYEHAFAATARFFAKGRPHDEQYFKDVIKIYANSCVKSITFFDELYKSYKPSIILLHHGIYVPQGLAVDVAKVHSIRVVTWTPSYRKGTFLFAENDTYHKVLPDESTIPQELSSENKDKITSYLKSRQFGSNDWIWFNNEKPEIKSFRERNKISPDKKIVSAFTNVFWDAQLHFKNSVFEDMLEWLEFTIDYASQRDEIFLVIRAHPAEFSGFIPSRQPLEEMLSEKIQNLNNVLLISGDSKENSYSLAQESDLTIVYGSKIAGELAALGSRVIVAGEAWAKHKGFTIDISSKDHYIRELDKQINSSGKIDKYRQELALKYCYYFFYERMVELEFAIPTGDKSQPFEIKYSNWKELKSMKYPGLETILSYILGKKSTCGSSKQFKTEYLKNISTELSVLDSKESIVEASNLVNKIGLTSHHDPQKNWDTLKMVAEIFLCETKAPIVLDAGSGAKSVNSQWIRKLCPDARLYACDRVEKPVKDFKKNNIEFSIQDMSNTDYPDEFFDYITSLSVIEHGVDVFSFLDESIRILKHGGKLLISTDYWDTKINTEHKFPYGEKYGPMIIFSKEEIEKIIDYAESIGFKLVGSKSNLRCTSKAITWERMQENYTFAFLSLIKR